MASQFTLKLLDKLSGPASAMSRALQRILRMEDAVTAGSAKVDAATGRTAAAMGAAAAKATAMAKAFQMAARAQDKFKGKSFTSWSQPIGPVLDRGAQDLSMSDRLSVATRGLFKWNRLAGESIDKWKDMSATFMRTPFGMVLFGLGKVGSALFDVIKYLGSALLTAGKLAIALGAIAAIGFTKLVVEMGAFAEKSKRALGFITGDKALGIREFRGAVELSAQLGTNLEDTVAHYSKLRSMQFSATEAAGLVKLSTDLKAITGDSQAAERALTAMTQIKAKGKLQSEELVGQLAEAGVSTVLVYKELEKLLGTDRKGVLSLLQKGQVDSETGLVAVVRALKQKYHVKNVGVIGKDFAENTIAGLWESLKNAPARMFMRIGEQIDNTPLVRGLQVLKRALDGAFQGDAGVRFVNAMVSGLGKLIPLVVEFAKGFGDGLGSIADALSFGESGNVAQWARDAGKSTAEFFAKVIRFSREAIPVLLEAGSKFLNAFDVNGLLDSLNRIDFAQLGKDLMVIAEALGKIMHWAAGWLQGAETRPTPTIDQLTNPRWDGAGGWEKTKAMFGFGEEGIFTKLFGDAPEPRAARVEPAIDAAGRAGMTNHISIPVTVNASGGSPEEHAAIGKTIGNEVTRAMRKFADGELAQATG